MKNELPVVFKEIMARVEHQEGIAYQEPEGVAEAASSSSYSIKYFQMPSFLKA